MAQKKAIFALAVACIVGDGVGCGNISAVLPGPPDRLAYFLIAPPTEAGDTQPLLGHFVQRPEQGAYLDPSQLQRTTPQKAFSVQPGALVSRSTAATLSVAMDERTAAGALLQGQVPVRRTAS